MAVDWFGFGYAALVTSGGLIGYVKAGSVPSLAAGLFFGGLAGLGAYQLSQNPNNIWLSLSICCLDCTISHLSYIWNTVCHHGNEILQLQKIHARGADCWCQFVNGWKISTEDVRKAPG
ncbi:transmembrane protein 14C isoform X1 [Manacus vitellinus]|uniref:transmembrane protein 14C isoform X1 n=1 Tax=Manacus vitellinus TaxID=328815 RepID=UPI0008465770|nr:transmembrane protein 14C isoform X1 [Manacus vitellinus]XP_029817558.1 transmembrane protein 14C isoform X1 [Manacus vitellinus]XP_029817559.1 transmembrane protein 14C isoform X1 [Manacus vitellinus]